MSQSYAFYKARAEDAASEAKGATLSNVKERHLQAEKTWRGLAEQARKVEVDREKARKARAVRREIEERSNPADAGE